MKGQNTSKKRGARWLLLAAIALLSAAGIFAMQLNNLPNRSSDEATPSSIDLTGQSPPALLSDPFLQLPTQSSVKVVWFTEFPGTEHTVEYGDGLTAQADTLQLSRTREDKDSKVAGRSYDAPTMRPIWRHEATITGLEAPSDLAASPSASKTSPHRRLPYRVISHRDDGQTVTSDTFTLAAAPPKGTPLKILLTSDHQLMPMTAANLQKVAEIAGRVDAVFLAGDLVNVPDRASEWFDDARGRAFFPGLQGRAQNALETEGGVTTYTGGALIQHAPLFPALGNHEVMGRYGIAGSLNSEFSDPIPRRFVSQFYPDPEGDVTAESWIADHSYNTSTYEEIFSLPTTQLPNGKETQTYYAMSFGDVRLVSLYVTQIWRSPNLTPDTKGRYREKQADLKTPEDWGHGQHIFEDIRKGSVQYEWLKRELASDEFQSAKYKIVMLHHPPHTLGGNIVPAFTDPVAIENRAEDGTLRSVQYEYPQAEDYIIRDLIPLLESANVQLVFYGHSHIWNRFFKGGLNFLETSNVGNSYGAHLKGNPRQVPAQQGVKAAGDLRPFDKAYAATGDPNGLEPITPTLAPLTDEMGNPLPYIASNDITSFTLFDTGSGLISSYYFDTREPDSDAVKFDEFK
ncbi:MAG: metallophosphoesterase, partial [Phormidesmis sp.]